MRFILVYATFSGRVFLCVLLNARDVILKKRLVEKKSFIRKKFFIIGKSACQMCTKKVFESSCLQEALDAYTVRSEEKDEEPAEERAHREVLLVEHS